MFCFFFSENVRCWFVKTMAGNNIMPHRELYFVRPVQYMLLANTPAVGVLAYYRAKLFVQSSFWLLHIIRLVRWNWYPVTVFRTSGLVDLVQVILSTVLTLVSCWTPIFFPLTPELAISCLYFLPSFQLHPFPLFDMSRLTGRLTRDGATFLILPLRLLHRANKLFGESWNYTFSWQCGRIRVHCHKKYKTVNTKKQWRASHLWRAWGPCAQI